VTKKKSFITPTTVWSFHVAGVSENRFLEGPGGRPGADQREGVQGGEILLAQVRRLRPDANLRPGDSLIKRVLSLVIDGGTE
jgi:hypothetical protein